MTVDDLRRTLDGVPGHYRIWITVAGDEIPARFITQDRNTIRLCSPHVERIKSETVIYDEEPAA